MITSQLATSSSQVQDQASFKVSPELRKATDPNQLDFEQLIDNYVSDYTIKIPFVKSTFIHGSFLPSQIQFGTEKPKDELVLTMELVQAPHHLKTNQLADPEYEQNMKIKKMQASRKSMGLAEGRAQAEAAINEQSEDEKADQESGEENESVTASADGEEESDSDREYTGDMFKNKEKIAFESKPLNPVGVLNKTLNVYEYVCFSIFRTRKQKMRYCRLQDAIIPIAPLSTDQKFRVSHSGLSAYYLGEEADYETGSKKKVIVVISLQDLSYQTYDVDKLGKDISSLENSSLIMKDSALCFQFTKPSGGVADVSCFSVIDLAKMEVTWTVEDAEMLAFAADELDEEKWYIFGERQLNEDGESAQAETPDVVYVIRRSLEVKPINEGKDEKLTKQANKNKKERRDYFRTYSVAFGEKIEEVNDDQLVFEGYVVSEDRGKPQGNQGKHRQQRDGEQEPVMASLNGQPYNVGINKLPEKKVKKEVNFAVYACDKRLETLNIIYMGKNGESHTVFQFWTKHCEKKNNKGPQKVSNRSGSTKLEFNQNTHLYLQDFLFIIQTESSGKCTAKNIDFRSYYYPQIQLDQAQRDLFKDVIVYLEEERSNNENEDNKNGQEETTIYNCESLCMSNTDDSLHTNALQYDWFSSDAALKNAVKQSHGKIRSQKFTMDFPCLIYNVGLNKLMIQSTIAPDVCTSLELEKRDFLSFVKFSSFADIGLLDKRRPVQKNNVPFEQSGTKVAFMARDWHGRNSDDQWGAVYLNVLTVDPFTQKVELLETSYEAEMNEGIIDDYIYSAFITQITSLRGLDVTFVVQYNDAIIFDCISSTKQEPVRFPIPIHADEKLWDADKMWSYKEERDIGWEELDISKGARPVQQYIQQDKDNVIHFLVQYDTGVVKVLRVDPTSEMGEQNFIKSVYSLQSQQILCFTYDNGAFYLMDDKRVLRKLVQDATTHELRVEATLEINSTDKSLLYHDSFSEIMISDDAMHWDDKVMYLSRKQQKDNFTWSHSSMMSKDHKHIQGPKKAKSSGMVWYIEQYDTDFTDEKQPDQVESSAKNLVQNAKFASKFKGFSVMLKPPADFSFIDILPQGDGNHSTFSSYIDEQHILTRYSGRFFVFHNSGKFLGQVQFSDMQSNFQEERLKLVCVSDNSKYFVFHGPGKAKSNGPGKKGKGKGKNSKQQETEANEEDGGGESARQKRVLYAFKLEEVLTGIFAKKSSWRFIQLQIDLEFIQNPVKRQKTRYSISHDGIFSQVHASCDQVDGDANLIVSVQTFHCTVMVKPGKLQSNADKPDALAPYDDSLSDRTYSIEFEANQRSKLVESLTEQIKPYQKKKQFGKQTDKDAFKLDQLLNRRAHIDSAWLFANYIVFKCGLSLKYMPRTAKVDSKPWDFQILFDSQGWICDVIPTGIDDLVQVFVVNDKKKRFYVITWNLKYNREHSNYQSVYDDTTNPEYLLLRSYGHHMSHNFNFIQDKGGIINLQNNLPVQFFDLENERDWCPRGELINHIEGQRKMQSDNSKCIELTQPGRIQHFVSISDLTYWARFQAHPEHHELMRERLSKISPFSRFFTGISPFHMYATNLHVLRAAQSFIQHKVNSPESQNDARITMLPLVFLHSDPKRNQPGVKTTPLHLALDQQSPLAFDIMLGLLGEQNKVCVTQHLLDRLGDIVDIESKVVLDFFNNCFFTTDQFCEPMAIEWGNDDEEELFVNVPTSYLTKEYIQSFAQGDDSNEPEEEPQSQEDKFQKFLGSAIQTRTEGLIQYTEDVEDFSQKEVDQSNLKQVQVKLLDFNWIFFGNQAKKFISVLSNCENDQIFATKQIKVLIEFFWQGYFQAITDRLFLPFAAYMLLFCFFVTYLEQEHTHEMSLFFCFEMACIVIMGKLYVRFALLEAIQISIDGWTYFTDFWNLVDITSLILNAYYVCFRLRGTHSPDTLNVIGSVCIAIMWTKMFYWMRIFKPFASFIRVVEAIMKHIAVFSAMLIMVLLAFMNIIIVLQNNRSADDPPIFDAVVNIVPLDAIIHAYLLGLGEFGKDNYSEHNGFVLWMFFLAATFIVQLVFMNLLIALMGDAYGEIMGIQEQSTMKELCCMMNDHIWLLEISQSFQHSRYILSLTPDNVNQSGSSIERQISQLQDYTQDRLEASDNKILRELQQLKGQIEAISGRKAVKEADDGDMGDNMQA